MLFGQKEQTILVMIKQSVQLMAMEMFSAGTYYDYSVIIGSDFRIRKQRHLSFKYDQSGIFFGQFQPEDSMQMK